MEQDYLDNLHGILKDIYGDEFSLDIDSFKSKMVNEAPYRDNVYGIMQDEYGSEFTLDPKTFYNKVLESSKKKSQSEIGSQATQPGGGSENAQYAFEPGFQGEKPFFQTLRPEDQQFQEEQQVSEKPKRVIYRGEGTREALETQFAPEVKKEARKATVVEATKPIAKEMGEVIKPTSKIQKLADLNYMNQNPDDFNATYYDVFKDEAEKSGDPEKYSKDLKDKYANDFIDEEFKEEFNIANELKYIEDKMKREISSLQSNPNAKTPQGQEYIKNKINEYTQLIQSKTAKLDEVRKANNQKYQQRIDEIDNLFKTGESFMREDGLNAEKNELMRKMKLIKLAENPQGLKQEVGEQEYNKIPGSTADEKLNNYLNTRLTIYDQFKEDALDAAFDRNRFYGEKKDRADQVYNSYMNLKGELKDLYYLAALKRYANPEDRSNFLEAAGEGFLGGFAEGAFNFDDVGKKHSENLQKIAQEAGIQYSDQDKSFIEYTSAPAEPWSSEWWGDMTGTSSAFMAELALTRKPTSAVLKAAGSALKAAPQVTKIAQAGLSRYDKLGKTGQKFVNTVFSAAEEGAYFEGANQMLHDGESSELTFLTGLTGGLLAAPVNALLKKTGGVVFNSFKKGAAQEITKDALTAERAAVLESLGAQKDEVKTLLSQFVKPTAGKDAVYMISGTFGKQSPKVIDLLEKVGTHLIARPTGEVAQEFGEELASIYQETSNFEEFKKEFSARFPDADAATQFVVASYMMGVGFGGGNFIGDVFTKKSKQGYDALTPEQKKVADKAIAEADAEIKNKEAEVLNEQEMNTPVKEKSKEETDWDNARVEIEGKISQSGNQISALENQKQKIYDKYGITDPKTQDISGLSNDDAIKIETINSEIQREKKVKSKEEINLSIHEDNKPVIEEAEESPMAVHADELIDKNKQDAVQERSAEEVLPREQGETTETGGEPQGMGQGLQGEEVAQEGKQEEVSVNREPIAEDIAPEQKAKIEEANAQDEDEAVTEIYDFNDEIKSVGTKEQFKAFLRSLSPKGVFSRIAWHNSDKEALQPREGQYYTNTRRNAEETYKREFTHPAIIFGNSPKKMDFDQVQEFDINDVKSQGNDIVITDDLSPAIGAEMNYREFIPSSAEQIIPIGTKENIDAFKAFVEQQKAPEVQSTEQVAEQPTPQVQEEKEPTTEEQTKMEDEAAKSEAMTPKNMKDLIGIYRKVFNLPYPKALVSAMVSNRLVKQMAKRAGVTPEQMYQKLSFQQITEQQLKGLSKNGKLLKQIVGKDAKAIKGKDFDFDGEYDVVANGSKIGKIHYDRSLKSWMNSEFYRGSERAGTYKWIYGDILGDTKQEAIDELIKRYNEAEQNQSEQQSQEKKPPVKKEITQEDVDDILGDIQDSGMMVQKSPIERGVYIINENVRLDLRAFDNVINLSSILSIEKGKGSASSVLREIGKSADKRGLTISLDAKAFSEGGLSTSELLDFYSRFGFEIDPNGIFKDDSIEEIKDYIEMYPNESVGMIRKPSQEILFQNYGEKTRGAVTIAKDGRAIIYALTDANVSTPLHELAHVFEHYLTDAEKNKIIKAAKTERWTKETSEYFARGFEKYLAEGKSSDPIFEKFKQFLLDIYKAIKGSPIDVKLNKQMKEIYAQMLGEDLTAELGEDIEEQETKLEEMEVSEANLVSEYEQIKNMSGIDKIDAMNKWKEKYGELANRYMYIENNYDKLAEQFKAIRTCEFE